MAEPQTKQTALERTKELTDRLEAGIQELFQSDKYKEYLKSMSEFHRYSTRNTLLIHLQNPHASKVASFKMWDEKFNRKVKKGEKSIRIFAPIMKSEKREFDKIDPETQVPMLDKNGKIITEELESQTLRFKLVPVFDVSQTSGEPLPKIVENLTGDVAQYEAFLDTLREISPLPIEFEPLRDNNDGYCKYGEKIGIRENMSEVQTISAVVHEIAHAKLHDRRGAGLDTAHSVGGNSSVKSKFMKEVEAESISYVVCQHYGIETSLNSFGYLAEWSSDNLPEFKASLDIIRKESSVLITAIEERFTVICKERGIDLLEKAPSQTVSETTTETPAIQEEPTEPTFTTETRTENIAGMEFTATDIIPEQPEEAFEITYWQKGTGTDVFHYFNEGNERYGDYETLAHIAPDRSVEFVKTDLSDEIIGKINTYAATAEIPNMAADISPAETPVTEVDKSAEITPDPSITAAERDIYGYTYADILPLTKDRALELYDNDLSVFLLYEDNSEAMAFERSEIEQFEGLFGIEREDWQKTAEYAELSAQDKPIETPVAENIQDSKAPPPEAEMPAFEKPIYRETYEYAYAHKEFDAYHEDKNLNIECRNAIDKAINESRYNTNFYKMKDAVKHVVDEYGSERVELLMAKIIQRADWDGRYSNQNKDWAKGFEIPENMKDIYTNTHPCLIDGFLDKVREKPSVLEALKVNTEKSRNQSESKPDTKKSKEMEM